MAISPLIQTINFRILAVIVVMCALLISSSCAINVRTVPAEGWNEVSTDHFSLLGYNENTFKFSREIFMGKNVRKFQLKLKTRTLNEDSGFLTGLQVKIYTMPDNNYLYTMDWMRPQEPDGGYWTPMIFGNHVRLEISSAPDDYLIDVGELGTRLYIEKVRFDWDSSINQYFIPSSKIEEINQTNVTDATPIKYYNQQRLVGVLIGPNGTHYHYTRLRPNHSYAVYVSPLRYDTAHDVGLCVGVSTVAFVNLHHDQSCSGKGRRRPLLGDSGIYLEIPSSPVPRTLYLTIKGLAGHTYSLAVNRTRKRFSAVYEMSDGLASREAPEIPRSEYVNNINYINVYGYQIANFVRRNATYLRRTREMIVIASAKLLAASEGYARFSGADIYKSEHYFLNEDVFLHQRYGRASASLTRIHLFLEELDEPRKGGSVMHHEWGHFEYGMDDEYTEDNGVFTTIDHNSVMGTHWGNNIPRFEFCTDLNHVWQPNWDPTEADDESNWKIFTDKYHISKRHNHAEGQYSDVLHALERLINFNYYE